MADRVAVAAGEMGGAGDAQSPNRRSGVRRGAVTVAAAGAFLAFLDTTVVNIAFPKIAASFPGAGRSELSWILDAYFVVIAALLVPAGAVAERVGPRRAFLWSVGGYGLTSVLCAIAPSWETLVAARVLQGITAAVIAPVSLALVLDEFPPAARSVGVALWGAAAALAAAVGPTLGGAIVTGTSWRWIFAINVPLGIVVIAAGRRLLTARPPRATTWPDLLGATLAAIGLGALALGIVEGQAWGWLGARTLCAFAVAIAGTGWLAQRIRTQPRPLIDPALLRVGSFTRGNVGTLLFSMAFFSTILGNVLFLTGIWHYTFLQAGLSTLPAPVLTTVVSGPAGSLADRIGHRTVVFAGGLVFFGGLVLLHSAGPERDYLGTWLPGASLTGLGTGLAFPTLGAAAVRDIDPRHFAAASAVNAAFRQIGAALGTAILIAVIGTPRTPASALSAAHHGYVVGLAAALATSAAALMLVRGRPVAAKPSPTAAEGTTALAIEAS